MEKINLWKEGKPSLTPYLISDNEKHPAVLIIPGGGYGYVCECTEGGRIAIKYNQMGFHTFVLDYRVAPHRFPAPQQDAFRAMQIIRGNAEKWMVIPDEIAAAGFSAGGHLAASLGTLMDEINFSAGDEYDAIDPVPNGLVLCYPVISFEDWSHVETGKNLLGDRFQEDRKKYSLDRRVSSKTPPVFLWHTIEDQSVNYRNSMVFAEALTKQNIPCELHVFPFGKHGMLLGFDTLDLISWPEQSAAFLRTQWIARKDPEYVRTRYTNAYQSDVEWKR